MLDKNEKKRLAKEYAALIKKIERVLKRFSPIDPNDEYSMGDDYEPALPNIVSILLRTGDRDELLAVIESTRLSANVPADREKDWKIVDAILKSARSKRPPPKPKPRFTLDVRDDVEDIRDFILKRVIGFDLKQNQGPGHSERVQRIVFEYQCDQAGWLTVIFDLSESSESYCTTTKLLDSEAVCERKSWFKAWVGNCRGPIEIIDISGQRRQYAEGEAPLAEKIGEMIQGVVIELRDEGLFSQLPIALHCRLFVQDFDGCYAWPDVDSTEDVNFARSPLH